MYPSNRSAIIDVTTVRAVLVALSCLVVAGERLQAQTQGTLAGQVTQSVTQEPLAGAQVSIDGTALGALTNAQGQYVIPGVPAGEVVVRATFIGYSTVSEPATVTADGTTTVDFELRQSALELDQIVVTGAGVATERRKLGNTIATVDMSELETAPVATVSEVLSGREPGVLGLPSGGIAGDGARIRIRGSSSLSQSNEPIIYVDGIRVDNAGGFAPTVGAGGGGTPSRLDDINPEAIERIEILKGAAAATLYGTEASNGVIQIFTKRGRSGPPQYRFEVKQGFSEYPSERLKPPLAGFVTSETAGQLTRGSCISPDCRDVGVEGVRQRWGINVAPYEVFEVDPFDDIFSTGYNQTYSLSVSGGSPDVTYFVSGRFQKENGPYDGSDLQASGLEVADDEVERRQVNANVEFFPWAGLRVRVSSAYTELDQEVPDNNNNIFGVFSTFLMSKPEKANQNNLFGTPAFATTRENFHRRTMDDTKHFSGALTASYRPASELTLDATFGVDFTSQRSTEIVPFGWNVDDLARSDVKGERDASDRSFREVTLDVKGVWSRAFGDWSSELVLGAQGFLKQIDSQASGGEEFPGRGLDVTGAGAIPDAFESFLEESQVGGLVQEQIGWRDFAFLTLGARLDEHSAFGKSAGAVFYPKAGLAIMPSSLPSWGSELLSSLRLHAAVGTSGLQPGAFDQFTTFGALASEFGAGIAPDNLGNPDLKPERSTEWEFGADVGLFQDRASVEATFWTRTVEDALVDRQFVPSGGFMNRQLANIGQLDAHGLELGINALAYQSRNFAINLFANAAFLDETLTDLGDAPPLKVGGSYPRYRQFTREGTAPGAFFGAKLDESVEFPIDLGDCQPRSEAELLDFFSQPRSPNDFGTIVVACGREQQLLQPLGKSTPDWQGAFGGDITLFGSVTLRSLFEFRAGNYQVHDLDQAFRRSNPSIGRNVRKPAELEAILLNPESTAEERLAAANTWAREVEALSPLDGLNEIHDADFIRFRELSLTYRLPTSFAQRLGARDVSFTASGRNLALWTNFPGRDPEQNALSRGGGGNLLDENFNEGTAAFGVPLQRRIEFAVRASF